MPVGVIWVERAGKVFQGEGTAGAKVGNCVTLWPGSSARIHGLDFWKLDVPMGVEWDINIGGQQELSRNTVPPWRTWVSPRE